MSELQPLVHAVLERAGLLIPVGSLRGIDADHRAGPWRWLVIGRRSCGKSQLINRLVDADAPVGLGGVTSASRAYASGDLVLYDTPGLEHELDGADAIEACIGSVDGLLWVVDGLQPLTRVERAAVARAVPDGVVVVGAISRLDLVDPKEHAAIFERVRQLLAVRGQVPVHAVTDLDALRSRLTAPDPDASPARRARLRGALEATATALEHLGSAAGPDPQVLSQAAVARWRAGVEEAHAAVAEAVREASLVFRDEALDALHARLVALAEVERARLRDALSEAPSWQPAPRASLDLKGQVQDLVGGSRHVLDGLDDGASRWTHAGVSAFEGLVELPNARALLARRAAIEAAQTATAAAIEAVSSPP